MQYSRGENCCGEARVRIKIKKKKWFFEISERNFGGRGKKRNKSFEY